MTTSDHKSAYWQLAMHPRQFGSNQRLELREEWRLTSSSSAASPVRCLSIDEGGLPVHVGCLPNLTAGMSYSSQLLPAEDADAVWLFGTVAGMTYKDQYMCQNTI